MQLPAAILAAIILPIVLLLGALLLLPIHLALKISKREELLSGSLHLSWLGVRIKKSELPPQSAEELLAGLSGPVDAAPEGGEEREVVADNDQAPGRQKGEESSRESTAKIRPQTLMRAAPALAGIFYDLLCSIVFNISGGIVLGLDDPAETAVLSGQIWALSSALGRSSSQFRVDPWFDGERLEGDVYVDIRAKLVWGLVAALRALRIKEIRQIGREMIGWS
jgi:hypothetical protein